MAVPSASSSKRTPHSALSNLWHRNMLRTPRSYSSPAQRGVVGPVALGDQDLLAAEGFGGLDAQDDREFALFDQTRRACALSVTTRNQPLPVPPYIRSM
ncbi:hypothetical protein SHIRM173S_11246 [Streptomyces hirsutus]